MASSVPTPPGTPKKLQKKPSKCYSTTLLYNSGDALAVLSGLSLAACNPTNEENTIIRYAAIAALEEEKEVVVEQRADFTSVSDKMSCSHCTVEFTSREEQKSHFKSDWHRYNLQRKIKGHNSVTEEEFEDISDVSSISGSESSSDESESEGDTTTNTKRIRQKLSEKLGHLKKEVESASSGNDSESEWATAEFEAARKYPKLFFRNKDGNLISVFRCVVYHKKNPPCSQNQLLSMVSNLPHHLTWGVFMASGGHFAGGIFEQNKILVHKTFHRYVVRAKRGTAQGSRDSQGNAPKSAGATLRRYNEAALKDEICDLIASWSKELEKCDLIFLRAPSFNKKIFFSGKSPPFSKGDHRIRMIPFATRRPTFNEIRRVHEMLSSVECYGEESAIQDHIPLSPPVTFSAETGHLEVVPPEETQTSPRHRKLREKGKISTSPLVYKVLESDGKQSIESNVIGDPQLKDKTKNLLKGQQLHVIDALRQEVQSSSGASTVSESELVETMESLSTTDLKQFDGTKKPRSKKNRARKRRPSLKHQVAPDTNAFEEEKYHLKNSLYTACKVGDIETLQNLLAIFSIEQPVSENLGKQNTTDLVISDPVTVSDDKVTTSNCEVDCTNSDVFLNSNENSIEITPPNDTSSQIPDSISSDVITCNISVDSTSNIGCPEKVLEEISNAFQTANNDIISTSKADKVKMNLNVPNEKQKDKTQKRPRSGSAPEELLSPIVNISILNDPIGDQQLTLLHVASKEGQKKVIKILLEAGADPAIKDKYGMPPYTCTDDKETRNEYRRFRAKYPTKFDYDAAKIPSPLTPEMEAERKQKVNDRKRAQKKIKQQKQKEQKALEEIKKAEEAEKNRFLSLSDREKRALAAEKRLLQKSKEDGSAVPVMSRCFQCGMDMTGKVPFEYNDYRFCTTKCLKEHRLASKPKS